MRAVRALSLWTFVGMGIVLIQGALVTQTESGRGCGDDWPLCHGKFLPAYTIESIIEYSHRFISGIVGLLVIACAVAVCVVVRSWYVRSFALLTLFFTLLQALLGAMQVRNPQSDAILALHFGFALLAFTLSWIVFRAVRGKHVIAVRVALPMRLYVALLTVYAYVVVYSGAYTSHTGAAGACSRLWTCPEWGVVDLAAVLFGHRLAAVALSVFIAVFVFLVLRYYRAHRSLVSLSWGSIGLIGAQLVSGLLLTAALGSDWYIFATLLHTAIVALLFAVLSMCTLIVWQRGVGEEGSVHARAIG
ncbi:MAG: COX15/CtaA family protein [Paenibacillaceae bacterium]|nr:COX15/CtaA family protein [Paenibacillaceae bacterium]